MRKNKLHVGLLLMLALTMLTSAALAKTIATMPSTIDPQHLAHCECRALIQQYNMQDNSLEIILCDVEAFDADAVKGLQAGDTIVAGGTEYAVKTVRFEDDYRVCLINESDDEYDENALTLTLDAYTGTYAPVPKYDIVTWLLAATINVEAPESLVLLDGVDVDTGEPLDTPILYGKADFVQMVMDCASNEEGLGFSACNVYVLFDEGNLPVVVRRFYVPWQ